MAIPSPRHIVSEEITHLINRLPGEVRVQVRQPGGAVVTFRVPAESPAESLPDAAVEPHYHGPHLSEGALAVLAQAAAAPITAKALASRAGYRCNSHFRGILTDLSRRGLLVRTPDGYHRPGAAGGTLPAR